MPAAALAWMAPDSVRGAWLGPGVWYRHYWTDRGPWAIYLVEADLSRCDLALRTLRARPREEGGVGRERVSSMVARAGPGVLAAVNADFFTPEGRAVGTEVARGEVTARSRSRPVLAWRPASEPWIGVPSFAGDTLLVGWPVPRRTVGGATEAVSGFPELLARGERVGDLNVGERPGFAASRHPRTAVAYDADSRRLWLVVVDGRQAPYSVGMTLPEITGLLEALGAEEAVNLDGGGSSTLVVKGRIVNRPSDAEGERPVVNALALSREVARCGGGKR